MVKTVRLSDSKGENKQFSVVLVHLGRVIHPSEPLSEHTVNVDNEVLLFFGQGFISQQAVKMSIVVLV